MPGRRGRPPHSPTTLDPPPAPPGPPQWYVVLLADDDAELELAAGAHRRLGKYCSPGRATLWVGAILVEDAEACTNLAKIKMEDFSVTAIVYETEDEAMASIRGHMNVGIDVAPA